MMIEKTKVYVGMIADLLHAGHIQILEHAAKYGEVIVGLYTKELCEEIGDVPHLSYENRKKALSAISYVKYIVPQKTPTGISNLKSTGIKIVVHGDDWKNTKQSKVRKEVLEYLNSVDGQLIEIPYNKEIGSIQIKEEVCSGITPTIRLNSLSQMLKEKRPINILEVHNAITGLIVEKISSNGKSFDGMWSSSLTDSTSKGRPDNESLDSSARLHSINEIFEATTKPMIYDGDTGGKPEHFPFVVKNLERVGVSAVIIEDKCGLKKNSLYGMSVKQEQDTIENFSYKISVGKKAQVTKNFMIIARIESFILQKPVSDALDRARAYIKAGADGIMIHSKEKHGNDILEFLKIFREEDPYTPIVVVPTSYNHLTSQELYNWGANIIIYANHMLRSAYPAMVKTAKSILDNDRSKEADEFCMPIKEILELI